VAILENYSRAMLASAVTLSQDANAYLSVLHAAIGRHGSPKAIVTFAKAETWEELVAQHDLWLERHNTHGHRTHENREDGRRSPSEVLGPVRMVRHHPTDLSRAFFSTMLIRRLDASGYACVKHWWIYAEEGLARCEVAVWLGDGEMAVEYGGQTLSRYDVSLSRDAATLEEVTNPRLFATAYGRSRSQLRLFALQDALGDVGWLKAIRLEGYTARSRRSEALQQTLFPYLEAL
jgi:hypothetical protein